MCIRLFHLHRKLLGELAQYWVMLLAQTECYVGMPVVILMGMKEHAVACSRISRGLKSMDTDFCYLTVQQNICENI